MAVYRPKYRNPNTGESARRPCGSPWKVAEAGEGGVDE
jgi:hypothetical protein